MISGRSVGHPVGKTITWCTFTLPRGKLAGYVHGEHSGKEDIARQRQLGWNLPNRDSALVGTGIQGDGPSRLLEMGKLSE
jgi:hypothetical protein